jgi:NTE family protein
MNKVKIGLALGGGGPKGITHIGVLKVLAKYKIPIDYVAGTSAGAIAGGFYAANLNPLEMEDYLMKKGWLETIKLILDPSLKQGLLQGKKLEDFLQKYLKNTRFQDLKIPFKAVATNLANGEKVVLDKGDLIKAIIASCSIPMIFKPVNWEGKLLVDGGICSPVPVNTVRKMGANIVIAVNLYNHNQNNIISEKNNFITNGLQTINLMINRLSLIEIQTADLIVNPEVDWISLKTLISQKGKIAAIAKGELAMETMLPELRRLIALKQKSSLTGKLRYRPKSGT